MNAADLNAAYRLLCDSADSTPRGVLAAALDALLAPLDAAALQALARANVVYCPARSKAALRAALARKPLLINDLSGEIA